MQQAYGQPYDWKRGMLPESLPSPAARLIANIQATGHGGGHDLHLRTLRAAGVTLAGHFLGAAGGRLRFADDLAETVAWGDERYTEFTGIVRKTAVERGIDPPDVEEPEPFDARGPRRSTWTGLAPSSSPADSGPTTARGCPGRKPSTSSASRSSGRERAR